MRAIGNDKLANITTTRPIGFVMIMGLNGYLTPELSRERISIYARILGLRNT